MDGDGALCNTFNYHDKKLHLWCQQGPWIHHWYLCSLFLSAYSSEKSQEVLKNPNKVLEKHLERYWLLEKIKVFNQDLSLCRKTCTTLMLKMVIDFITFWYDPIKDGSITIINILGLFKQIELINVDKICVGSDDCKKWERRI